jgi:hypothetical protein
LIQAIGIYYSINQIARRKSKTKIPRETDREIERERERNHATTSKTNKERCFLLQLLLFADDSLQVIVLWKLIADYCRCRRRRHRRRHHPTTTATVVHLNQFRRRRLR